ncbi:MAG TPA: PqqD family peptide modification chaperone [Roseiflexaceae bacterium]|nr:PqqD family peptide modification chaperone [Roseiflexaceae bacterium]
MGREIDTLIRMLQISLAETLAALAPLADADLDEPSDHPCALGGSVRDLLTHNIDHERMHAGQLFSARYNLKLMQKGEVHRLLAETIRARTELIAALVGLPDEAADMPVPDEDWTIREMVEHTVYWERHSVDDLARRRLAGRASIPPTALGHVVDPLYGPLPLPRTGDREPRTGDREPTTDDRRSTNGYQPPDGERQTLVDAGDVRSPTVHGLPSTVYGPPGPPSYDAVFHAPEATYRTRGGVTLVIDGARPHWVSVSATGAEVLRLCDGRRTVGEIGVALAARHGIPQQRAAADALAFLEQAQAVGYVSDRPRLAPAYRGRAEAIDLGRLADLYLFVTNDCNLRCTHCYVSSGDYVPPRELSLPELQRVVDEARALGVQRFYVTGGEPFMVRGIADLIAHITAESDLVLLTNGMFLTEKNVRRLAGLRGRGRLSFQISLDGPTAELHNAIRGPGAFELTTRYIPNALAAGLDVTISTAVSAHTVDHMADMTRLVARLGVRQHHILWMQEWGRALDHRPALLVPPARVSAVMREVRAVAEELGVTVDNEASLRVRVRGKRGRKTDLCSCGWESLAVFSDGQVYPCVWLAGAPGLGCGSVLEQPLEQIWRTSPVLREVRAASVQQKEICNGCHLKFLCAGGSPCSSYFGSLATRGKGDFLAAEPYCETFMDLTHDMLWEQARPDVGFSMLAVGLPNAPIHGQYAAPVLYKAMEGQGAHCMRPNTVAIDRAFEVGGYHCVCVLEPDVAEGAALKSRPVQVAAPNPVPPDAVFDAVGERCVELLLPMSRQVRALRPGQVLKVLSDDPTAREDLDAWCRMTGHELLAAVKGDGASSFFIRRGAL